MTYVLSTAIYSSLTTFSTTNLFHNKLQPLWWLQTCDRAVTALCECAHYTLHDVRNWRLALFYNQEKLLRNKKDLLLDFMSAHLLFPRAELGWEKLMQCQVPSPVGCPCLKETMVSLGKLPCLPVATVTWRHSPDKCCFCRHVLY